MGNEEVFQDNVNLVRFHEQNNQFRVVGITSATRIYSEFEDYRYIPKDEAAQTCVDFIVIMARGSVFKDVYHEAVNIGILKKDIYL